MKFSAFRLFAPSLLVLLNSCEKEPLGKATQPEMNDSIEIVIQPSVTRAIEGISELERERYFAVAESGIGAQRALQTEERFQYLFQELDAKLGRILGPVSSSIRWGNAVQEDPKRPGFVDLDHLKKVLSQKSVDETALREIFGENLNIAAHGQHNAFPAFMGKHDNEHSRKKPEHIPKNIAAAAELSATIFKHKYSDFSRPRYYEPLNEPNWSFYDDEHLAQWHLATKASVQKECPEVKVGGLCMSVSYFPQSQYKVWNGMKSFMDHTEGQMDFYSFHAYDYYKQPEGGHNETSVTSGLPIEGVLDLINNYAVNTYGKTVDIVISEQGGYVSRNGEENQYEGEYLAKKILSAAPVELHKEGFQGELQRRSTIQWIHLSSIIGNTLAFMDHPHSVQKAVPFLLPNTENWDPKYYASIYLPEDYQKGGKLTESFLLNFYKLMRGIKGRRVIADCTDQDLQVRSFVDGSHLFTIINNLSTETHHISLKGLKGDSHTVRQLSRGPNLIPSYLEKEVISGDLNIKGRDCIVLVSDSGSQISEKKILNERACYGNVITQKTSERQSDLNFEISMPEFSKATSPVLRVGFNRASDSDHRIKVIINRTEVEAPIEDSAPRYHHSKNGYSTTRLIPFSASLLKENNTITISFPDGKPGAVGSAVIRARFP